jgi:hypothetical protein
VMSAMLMLCHVVLAHHRAMNNARQRPTHDESHEENAEAG